MSLPYFDNFILVGEVLAVWNTNTKFDAKAENLSFGLTITENDNFIMKFRGQKMDYAKVSKKLIASLTTRS